MNKAMERIEKAVMSDAGAEAASILREAEDQLRRRLEQARREEGEKADAALGGFRRELEQAGQRDVARAERESRLEALEKRRGVMDEVFSEARRRLTELPPDRYRGVLKKWIEEIDAPDGAEIVASKKDAALMAELVAGLNAGRPSGTRFTLSPEYAPFEMGFIIKTGRYMAERSLSAWLDEKQAEWAPRLAGELFGNDYGAGS